MSIDNNSVILTENYGINSKKRYYIKPQDQMLVKAVTLEDSFSENVKYGFKALFKEIFLPQGYPCSVSEDYTNYQIWDTAQAFCSTITGILATQSIMKGVGVGDTTATPLAATITWVLKDGTGHVGRIAFAWWKGTSLDADSKMWRLVADVLNDAAICLEIAIPFFKGYTTYVLCLSTAMKAIVGVAGGATRAALTQHQALRGNLADVAAKDGSQETAVNLIASLVALLIITAVGENVWLVFFLFTGFHIFSNYMAVKSVHLKSFNRTRFLRVINAYLQNGIILDSQVVNVNEPVIPSFISLEKKEIGFNINLGHSLINVINNMEAKNIQDVINTFREFNYIIIVDNRSNVVHIVLNESVSSKDLLCSYFHAIIFITALRYINRKEGEESFKLCTKYDQFYTQLKTQHLIKVDENIKISIELYKMINKFVVSEWIIFGKQLEVNGWCLEKELLLAQEWRADWNNK